MLASYSFGELETPSEQRQALKAMWQATSDILIIVEPGTPAGSGLVRAARAQVGLSYACKDNHCEVSRGMWPLLQCNYCMFHTCMGSFRCISDGSMVLKVVQIIELKKKEDWLVLVI